MKPYTPGVTADAIVEKDKSILLVKRKNPPYKGCWAIPGGFLETGEESLERTSTRELWEETNLVARIEDVELLGVYSNPDRDPRGHIIAHVYIIKKFSGEVKANDDAEEARFFPLRNLPKLAFDHKKILEDYRRWKNGK